MAAQDVAISVVGLKDEDLLGVLQQMLQERTGVLQALTEQARPGQAHVPSKAPTESHIQSEEDVPLNKQRVVVGGK